MKKFHAAVLAVLLITDLLNAQNKNAALPVELVYFYAQREVANVMLYWGTATELNNYGFIPQRSVNDSLNFVDIGFVLGHGTTYSPKDYSYKDTTSIYFERLFYRLKQVDTNGDFKYSWVVEPDTITLVRSEGVELINDASISVYPNPFNSHTNVLLRMPYDGYVQIYIVNILGEKTIDLFEGLISQGNHKIIIDAERLASGIYFVILRTRLKMVFNKILNLK